MNINDSSQRNSNQRAPHMNTSASQNPSSEEGIEHPYADIINLSRPLVRNHPPMSRDLRAAQFAPYATLTGHKELIESTEANTILEEPEIIPDFEHLIAEENPTAEDYLVNEDYLVIEDDLGSQTPELQ